MSTFDVLHLGPAHDPGDVQVWIPQWNIVIAGDIPFYERMPPIFKDMRSKIAAHIDEGGNIGGACYVDQSNWAHLDTFEELVTRNAGRVFEEMEWE